ncbi:MAG: hypothetical protein PSY12_08165 [bacterium]|nr:hypothetical protein [bacterium]
MPTLSPYLATQDDGSMPQGGSRQPAAWLARPISSGTLTALLVAWFGLDQLLLWRFLDVMPIWGYALGAFLIGGVCAAILRAMPGRDGPSVATLLVCLAAALLLLLLGGEGRFFYANIDWQVRLAVMRDMTINPWPFVYTARATPDVLRAPIGMFLAPALAGKAWGERATDIALLLQNGLMLTGILGLGSMLFATRRARWIALAAVLAFSGLDALGRVLFRGGLADHLENWAYLQYSSTITLAFWVPQHALAGWIGAIGFLSWRAGKMPLGVFLALLPLTALWSPLGLMGGMPFAALAGIRSLIARTITPMDIALPTATTLLAVPGLIYMSAAGDDVGMRLMPLLPLQWGLFELLEVLVYAVPLLLIGAQPYGRDTLWLALVWLLALPFVQIGWSTDLMMRGSITELTILAILVADALRRPGKTRRWLIAMLLIGSVTGLAEIRRALAYPPAPAVRCSVFKAWDQSFGAFPKGSYIAPLNAMPALVRPTDPAQISALEPARCWDGVWHHPDDTSSGR